MNALEVWVKLLEDENVQLKSKLRDFCIEVNEPKTTSGNTQSEIQTSSITQTENYIQFKSSKLECNICNVVMLECNICNVVMLECNI